MMVVEELLDERQISLRIDSVNVNEFSFVVGEGEVDRTIVIENGTVTDRTLHVNITNLMGGAPLAESVAEDDIDAAAGAEDLQTVRIVLRNVTMRDVEFVVGLPKDAEPRLEPQKTTTTTEEPEETMETPTETTT